MSKTRKKLRPSNDSQKITADAWYYEHRSCIDVVVWMHIGGGRKAVRTVRIKARDLMASAKRCGWKKGKTVPRRQPHTSEGA